MRKIIETFQSEGPSCVSYARILSTMTKRNEPERDRIIKLAVSRLRSLNKEVCVRWLGDRFNAKNSPLVKAGVRTLNEAFYDFINAWGIDQDQILSDEQISQFFHDLSAGVDRKDVFEAHVLHPLHLI